MAYVGYLAERLEPSAEPKFSTITRYCVVNGFWLFRPIACTSSKKVPQDALRYELHSVRVDANPFSPTAAGCVSMPGGILFLHCPKIASSEGAVSNASPQRSNSGSSAALMRCSIRGGNAPKRRSKRMRIIREPIRFVPQCCRTREVRTTSIVNDAVPSSPRILPRP